MSFTSFAGSCSTGSCSSASAAGDRLEVCSLQTMDLKTELSSRHGLSSADLLELAFHEGLID